MHSVVSSPKSERGWALLINGVKSGQVSINDIHAKLGTMVGLTVEAALVIEEQKRIKRKVIHVSGYKAAFCDRSKSIKKASCGKCLSKGNCDIEQQLGYGIYKSGAG